MSETTLSGLIDDTVDSFKDYVLGLGHQDLLEFCQQDDPHDIISEMADGGVPIYTADILEAAANSTELATEPSELRQDGTPLEIITDNIYCSLQVACSEWWTENKDEIEDECQDIADALESFQDTIKHPDGDDGLDDAAVYKLIEILATEHGGEEDRGSVVDEDKTVEEIILDVLDSWYNKHKEKEKENE